VRTPHLWLLFLVYMFTGVGRFLVALHQLALAVNAAFKQLLAAGVLGAGDLQRACRGAVNRLASPLPMLPGFL
jgi:uncharacterized protein involved in response to NO